MFDMLIQGFRGTCGEDKMLAVLVGATGFNLKRSYWLQRGGNVVSRTTPLPESCRTEGWKWCFYSPDLSPVSAQSCVIKLCNLINGTW